MDRGRRASVDRLWHTTPHPLPLTVIAFYQPHHNGSPRASIGSQWETTRAVSCFSSDFGLGRAGSVLLARCSVGSTLTVQELITLGRWLSTHNYFNLVYARFGSYTPSRALPHFYFRFVANPKRERDHARTLCLCDALLAPLAAAAYVISHHSRRVALTRPPLTPACGHVPHC